jgi:hypothetical protein
MDLGRAREVGGGEGGDLAGVEEEGNGSSRKKEGRKSLNYRTAPCTSTTHVWEGLSSLFFSDSEWGLVFILSDCNSLAGTQKAVQNSHGVKQIYCKTVLEI